MEEKIDTTTVPYRIEGMLTIQEGLNSKSFSTTWLEKGATEEFDYAMAAGDEAHEYARSIPFEWWKKNAPDRQNQVTEIVDAWHFVMSQLIIDHSGNVGQAYTEARESYYAWDQHVGLVSPKKATKLFVAAMYLHGSQFPAPCSYMHAFWAWCAAAEVGFDLLYARYIAKATLNKFRVENGYKVGKYDKIWSIEDDREEDNFFLARWVDQELSIGRVPNAEEVADFLNEAYALHKANTVPAGEVSGSGI